MIAGTTYWKGQYRIASARKTNWDYRHAGAYFVTWCVKNRVECLSQIVQDRIELSTLGEIVDEEWQATEKHRSNFELDAWVIMPNHVHGILIIHSDKDIETATTPSRIMAQSLGAVIAQIKSISTKRIWASGQTSFAWQTRFYDRILRNDRALQAARTYIAHNPSRWQLDRDKDPGVFM